MKLYDMDLDKQEWREGHFQRGDAWRSNTAYQCTLCHVKTNRWEMGGWPGMGPRMVCPGTKYEEHDQLESLVKRYHKVEGRVRNYTKTAEEAGLSTQQGIDELLRVLGAEQQVLTLRIEQYRQRFSSYDDFQGLSDGARVEEYYPSSRYAEKEKLPK